MKRIIAILLLSYFLIISSVKAGVVMPSTSLWCTANSTFVTENFEETVGPGSYDYWFSPVRTDMNVYITVKFWNSTREFSQGDYSLTTIVEGRDYISMQGFTFNDSDKNFVKELCLEDTSVILDSIKQSLTSNPPQIKCTYTSYSKETESQFRSDFTTNDRIGNWMYGCKRLPYSTTSELLSYLTVIIISAIVIIIILLYKKFKH